jgi:hypothetical protein
MATQALIDAGMAYKEFKDPRTRPPCDMCGPFAGKWMRKVYELVDGVRLQLWRCEGCDTED